MSLEKKPNAFILDLTINNSTVTIVNVAAAQPQDSSIKHTLVQAVSYGLIYRVVDICLQLLVQWLF